jgi:hypothetical protein
MGSEFLLFNHDRDARAAGTRASMMSATDESDTTRSQTGVR